MSQVANISAGKSACRDFPVSVVTIGNFDGCHRGHQALIARTVQIAKQQNLVSIGVSFDPRPELYFRGKQHESSLFSPAQKTRAFKESGIHYHVIQEFNEKFSQITPIDFYKKFLLENLKAKEIVIGENFKFGHKRQGTALWLKEVAQSDGIQVHLIPDVMYENRTISSTRIRTQLKEGSELFHINAMLGRPYMLEGMVAHGQKTGRTLGYPTLNLSDVQQLMPFQGVFAGYVWLEKQHQAVSSAPPILVIKEDLLPAVFNIGTRPSINHESAQELRAEGHLFCLKQNEASHFSAYGQKAGFYLEEKIRGIEKFPNLEALKSQIAKDIKQAEKILIGNKSG